MLSKTVDHAEAHSDDPEFPKFMNFFRHMIGEEMVSGRIPPGSSQAKAYHKLFPQLSGDRVDSVIGLAKHGLRQGKKISVFAPSPDSVELAGLKRRLMEEGVSRVSAPPAKGSKSPTPDVIIRSKGTGEEPISDSESMRRKAILLPPA